MHVYRLVTGSTVEERILQRADAKLYLDQMVNRGSTAQVGGVRGVGDGGAGSLESTHQICLAKGSRE